MFRNPPRGLGASASARRMNMARGGYRSCTRRLFGAEKKFLNSKCWVYIRWCWRATTQGSRGRNDVAGSRGLSSVSVHVSTRVCIIYISSSRSQFACSFHGSISRVYHQLLEDEVLFSDLGVKWGSVFSQLRWGFFVVLRCEPPERALRTYASHDPHYTCNSHVPSTNWHEGSQSYPSTLASLPKLITM